MSEKKLHILDQEAMRIGKESHYGIIPTNRSINMHMSLGFINLDKPAGPTSHEVVSILKQILQIDKAGHSGTLDPNVTGVLPVGLLESTKVLNSLLTAPKEYVCNMHTKSFVTKSTLEAIFKEFTGTIYQVPPLKSHVVKKLRKRRIYDLKIIEQEKNDVLFWVQSEAGTYIRTLCEDIGRALGVSSYMKELRRIRTGPFYEKTAITLHKLFDAYENYKDTNDEKQIRELVIPIETAVSHLPKIYLRENAIDSICHGIDLSIPGIIAYNDFEPDSIVALFSPKEELIALGKTLIRSELLKTEKNGIAVHPNRVVMNRGTYPVYDPEKLIK